MATLEPKIVQRFWEKVRRGGENDCWLWTGTIVKSGHGQAWNGSRVVPAHRLVKEIVGEQIEVGRLGCHRCNNPACVNPSHIYSGTHSDNTRDAMAAGTHRGNPAPAGEDNYNAKLTTEKVGEIRRLYTLGAASQRELGRRFGVTHTSIGNVVHGETWKHA